MIAIVLTVFLTTLPLFAAECIEEPNPERDWYYSLVLQEKAQELEGVLLKVSGPSSEVVDRLLCLEIPEDSAVTRDGGRLRWRCARPQTWDIGFGVLIKTDAESMPSRALLYRFGFAGPQLEARLICDFASKPTGR